MSDGAADRLARVQALYRATAVGDWTSAEAQLSDDFVITEAPGLPFAGAYPGRTGLRALYETVMAMMDVVAVEVREITIGEQHAVSLVELVLAEPAGARALVAEMFRFRGEQICEMRPYYYDPAPVFAAVAAKRAGAPSNGALP